MNVNALVMFVEVMPMVLDFMTVAAFVLLCAYRLGLTLLSMSASVVASHMQNNSCQESANKSKHSDAASFAGVLGVKLQITR